VVEVTLQSELLSTSEVLVAEGNADPQKSDWPTRKTDMSSCLRRKENCKKFKLIRDNKKFFVLYGVQGTFSVTFARRRVCFGDSRTSTRIAKGDASTGDEDAKKKTGRRQVILRPVRESPKETRLQATKTPKNMPKTGDSRIVRELPKETSLQATKTPKK
jgi:hypothetical protein